MKTDSELLQEAIEIFIDFKRGAEFYYSAIEIDIYNPEDNQLFDGNVFEKRIDSLLKDFESKREIKQ